MKLKIILSILLFPLIISYSMNIDSLKNFINFTKSDTAKANSLIKLSNIYLYKSLDSSLLYSDLALKLSLKVNYTDGIAGSNLQKASYYHIKGDYNKAIQLYLIADSLYNLTKNNKGISNVNSNIGNSYYYMGKYELALKFLFKSLKIDNTYSYKKEQINTLINIGNVYLALKQYDKSIDFLKQSENVALKTNNVILISQIQNNLGVQYRYKKLYDKSLEYYYKALNLRLKIENNEGIAECYTNIGDLYFQKGNFIKANENFIKAREIYKKMEHLKGFAIITYNIGSVYDTINKKKEALEQYLKCIEISKKIKSNDLLLVCYNATSTLFESAKNFEQSLKYYKLYKSISDSVLNIESQKQINQFQILYETEKKETELKILDKDNKIKEASIKKQKILIITFFIGFIVIFIFSILLYRLLIKIKHANKLLNKQNTEILMQKEEILTQRDEIQAQRDLVTTQKEQIEVIYKQVTDSINYAKRIQEALLPLSDTSRSILGEHFIIFKPKDIVSGDFYWITKINNWLIVTVADCTGHGVPGAFMSMLGISFLNDIVRKQEINQANEVLNELRKEIINALQQKGKLGEQKDGMDISLIAINTETLECQWAGANNPLYIIKVTDNTEFAELTELKPDKMPIAIYERMYSFTNHEFTVKKGDCLYLFSDGFADQFGGPKGKKFMYKPFKVLLLTNCQKPMLEQKQIIEKTIIEWIDREEQVDDITVLGIKI